MTTRGVRRRTYRAWTAAGALLLLPVPGAAQEVRYSGSAGYAGGDYIFTERTESFALVNGLALRWDRLGVQARLPIVVQNSRAVTYLYGAGVPTGGPDNGAVRRRQPGAPVHMGRGHGGTGPVVDSAFVQSAGDLEMAVGDPIARVTCDVVRTDGAVRALEASAAVKAPLSDVDAGVGSGAWDASVGGSLVLGGGRTLLFLDASWWWLGDMPDLELRNHLEYGAGLGIALGDRWSLLAGVDAATRIIDAVDPPAALSVGVARRGGGGGSISAGLGMGLTESTADLSVFLGWSVRLRGAR